MSRFLLLIALFVSPMALASEPPPPPGGGMSEGGGGGGGGGSDPEMEFMANFSEISTELGLTEDQQTKIRDLFYNSQKEAIDLRATEQRTELDLRHAMSADTIDEKAVMKALDAHLAADGALKKNRVKLMIDLRKILSTEQWKKLDAMRSQRGGGRSGPSGGPGGGGHGPGGGMGGSMGGGQPPASGGAQLQGGPPRGGF